MNISIQGWKSDSVLDVPAHVHTRMHYAIGRFASRILRISVRLRDLNGPKGGEDKQCQIVLALKSGGEVVIEKNSSSWLEVVDTAAASAGRVISRIVSREHSFDRKTIRRAT